MAHLPHGFFMNWFGQQQGEGFDYHLLVLAFTVPLTIWGAGALSLDRETAGRDGLTTRTAARTITGSARSPQRASSRPLP